MRIRQLNWPIWSGLLLSLIAFFSYFFVFVWFPSTRDFPWANLLLFGAALTLLALGVRRGFSSNRPSPKRSKIAAVVVSTLGVAILGFFIFATFIMARWLPPSLGAPQVGQKAPDFSLADTNGRTVSLSELLASPINGKPTRGVLLVFYRGYW